MYQLNLLPTAIDDLRRLQKTVAQRIISKLRWLAENFDSIRPQGLVGPLAGLNKLRVGDYRVIYEEDRENRLITVHLIGHRREIYRQVPE
jgi:mRNA interferase RelE/StbE